MWTWTGRREHIQDLVTACPYGRRGDRLWVKEVWHRAYKRTPTHNGCVYLADYGHRLDLVSEEQARANWRWESSVVMPRWASRLTLEIVSVRVERLQEIDEAGAKAEGVEPLQMDEAAYLPRFEGQWNRRYGDHHAWEADPWVWVIEFCYRLRFDTVSSDGAGAGVA